MVCITVPHALSAPALNANIGYRSIHRGMIAPGSCQPSARALFVMPAAYASVPFLPGWDYTRILSYSSAPEGQQFHLPPVSTARNRCTSATRPHMYRWMSRLYYRVLSFPSRIKDTPL